MPQPGLQMLGTIQSGLEIGALARTTDGRYLQVNGSIRRELHPTRVNAAIERARRYQAAPRSSPPTDAQIVQEPLPIEVQANRPAAPPPTIVYKKRRLAAIATDALPG